MKNVAIGLGIILLGLVLFVAFVPMNENGWNTASASSGDGFKFQQDVDNAENKSQIIRIIEKCCPVCQKPNKPEKPETPLDPEQAMWKQWATLQKDPAVQEAEKSWSWEK